MFQNQNAIQNPNPNFFNPYVQNQIPNNQNSLPQNPLFQNMINNSVNVSPEEKYKSQLTQMNEMGFQNKQANIEALDATMGNVDAAIERMINLGLL